MFDVVKYVFMERLSAMWVLIKAFQSLCQVKCCDMMWGEDIAKGVIN